MTSLTILALVVVGGLILFLSGWRGRRVNDHPVCRKCGFDLFGLPTGGQRCSECGADLTRPRAIRDGQRVRRGGLVMSGLILSASAFTAIALIGWARLSNFDPNPWKPLSWVVAETKPIHPLAIRSAAFAELRRRIAASELDQSGVDYVADAGLAHQGDPAQVWMPEWGEMIEQLRAGKMLSDDRWQRYAKQASVFTLEIRPKVRRGDAVPVRVVGASPRIGGRPAPGGLYREIHFESLTIGGVTREQGGSIGSSLNPGGTGSGGWNEPLDETTLAKLADGKQPVQVAINIKLFEQAIWGASNEGEPLVAYPVVLEGSFELVPSDTETAKIVSAPELADAARAALSLRDVTYGNGQADRLSLMINVNGSPVTLSHELIARAGGREIKLGHVTSHPNRNASSNWSGKFPDLPGDRVDFVLRPTVAAAHGTTDVFEVWDGEIVFENEKVIRYDPATQRSR